MKYYIGIDLGGTNIVAGVVDEDYNIISKASTRTNCPRPAQEIADDMAAMAIKAVEDANLTMDQIEWVGVGTPGIANSETGIIEYSNNLGFVNTPMVEYIQKHINKPVFIENDANAAAYGEYYVQELIPEPYRPQYGENVGVNDYSSQYNKEIEWNSHLLCSIFSTLS